MKPSVPQLWLFLAISPAMGCATTRSAARTGVRGLWISAFEQSEFRPCDLTTQGSVWAEMDTTISNAIWRRVPSLSPVPEADTVFVRWDGTLSPPRSPRARLGGAYGHGGAYTHEFRVTALYEARRAVAGDCGMPESTSRPAR